MSESTQEGIATQFVVSEGDHIRHSAELGWFAWDGKVWQPRAEDYIYDLLRQYVKAELQVAVSEFDDGRMKALTKCMSAAALTAVLRIARAIEPVRVDDTAVFDAHPDLLNCQNGVVDLRYGSLQPHDPTLMMTKICSAGYDPVAAHEDVTTMLQAMPDPEVRSFMQMVVGSACSGRTPADDLMFVLDGGGSNGKSTLTLAAQTALGSYAAVVPDTVLASGSVNEHPTGLAEFRGLRYALLDETPEGKRLNLQVVKKLSSGNEVRARRMRQDFFSFMPSHTLIVATNHRPVVTETDRGTWRRLVLVPFPLSYGTKPGDVPIDPGLRDRLRDSPAKQAEAMLAWMIAGAQAWYERERMLTPLTGEIERATTHWRNECDVLSQFADEKLVFDSTRQIAKSELWAQFTRWAEANGLVGFKTARTFNAALEVHELGTKHKLQTRRSGGVTWWLGVGVQPPTVSV